MNAWIIVAIALVAAGLLITVILWLRTPGSAESEYVTVAELRARLEHEQEPDDRGARTEEPEQSEDGEAVPEPAETETGSAAAGPPDEPEALGHPTQKARGERTPEVGEEPPAGESDRNH